MSKCIANVEDSGKLGWGLLSGTAFEDGASKCIVDNDGNIFVTGNSYGDLHGQQNQGKSDAFVSKYDINGNRFWTILMGSTEKEDSVDIKQFSNGNLVVVGTTNGDFLSHSHQMEDAFVVVLDNSGDIVWSQVIGSTQDDNGNGVAIDVNSEYIYVIGNTKGDIDGKGSRGEWDIFVGKFSADVGNIIWSYQVGTILDDFGFGIIVSPTTPHIFIVGATEGSLNGKNGNGDFDIYVIKIQVKTVDIVWTTLVGSPQTDIGYNVLIRDSDSIVITGRTNGFIENQDFNMFIGVFSIDDGKMLYNRVDGSKRFDSASSATIDENGNIYVIGFSYGNFLGNTNYGDSDIIITHYECLEDHFDVKWTKQLGTPEAEQGLGITYFEHNLIFVGTSKGDLFAKNSGDFDIVIARIGRNRTIPLGKKSHSTDIPPNRLMLNILFLLSLIIIIGIILFKTKFKNMWLNRKEYASMSVPLNEMKTEQAEEE